MILPQTLSPAERAIGWALFLGGLLILLSLVGCACRAYHEKLCGIVPFCRGGSANPEVCR